MNSAIKHNGLHAAAPASGTAFGSCLWNLPSFSFVEVGHKAWLWLFSFAFIFTFFKVWTFFKACFHSSFAFFSSFFSSSFFLFFPYLSHRRQTCAAGTSTTAGVVCSASATGAKASSAWLAATACAASAKEAADARFLTGLDLPQAQLPFSRLLLLQQLHLQLVLPELRPVFWPAWCGLLCHYTCLVVLWHGLCSAFLHGSCCAFFTAVVAPFSRKLL